jgi:hypothetical protein
VLGDSGCGVGGSHKKNCHDRPSGLESGAHHLCGVSLFRLQLIQSGESANSLILDCSVSNLRHCSFI